VITGAGLGAGAGAGFGTAPDGRRKISETHKMPLESTTTPIPTWVYELDRMFARCAGEAMKADCNADADGPSPTFSPKVDQQQTTAGRFGVCASV
jgi:hypothetical protein